MADGSIPKFCAFNIDAFNHATGADERLDVAQIDLRNLNRDQQTKAIKAERMSHIVELVRIRPRSANQLAYLLGVDANRIHNYMRDLTAAGLIVRRRRESLGRHAAGSPLVLFASPDDSTELDENPIKRVMHKSWVTDCPPMFEPMARLFGRAA